MVASADRRGPVRSEVPLECLTPPPWMQWPVPDTRSGPSAGEVPRPGAIRASTCGATPPPPAGDPAMMELVLNRVREAVRQRHYSRRTEKAYVGWVRRFIAFQSYRDPALLGSARSDRSSLAWRRASESAPLHRTRHSAPSCSCSGRCSGGSWRGWRTRRGPSAPFACRSSSLGRKSRKCWAGCEGDCG